MRRGRAESLTRTASLIALGAFAVHQLRYLAGYGHAAGDELSRQGHDYLGSALPVLAALVLSGLAAGIVRAALGRGSAASRPAASPESRRARWALLSAAVLIVFAGQETIEGALSAGHPGGLASVLSEGGWTALPFALAVGGLCALLDRGLVTLERVIAAPGLRRRPAAPARPMRPRVVGLTPLAAAPLAFGIARRPPPVSA